MAFVRLNVGCGPLARAGWINVDCVEHEGVDLCGDLLQGLDIEDASIDSAVAMHVLQDISWADIPRALKELYRVLKPGGTLRLGVPDLDRAIAAYLRGDVSFFYVPDQDAHCIGAKLVTQIVWYGSTRTPFTFGYAQEILKAAGFKDVRRCAFRRTTSGDREIVSLDNRERETLFVEAHR